MRPKASSLWRVAITVAVFLGLAWYNLVIIDPPVKLALFIPLFILFILILSWIQVETLAERIWPGMIVAVRLLLLDGQND